MARTRKSIRRAAIRALPRANGRFAKSRPPPRAGGLEDVMASIYPATAYIAGLLDPDSLLRLGQVSSSLRAGLKAFIYPPASSVANPALTAAYRANAIPIKRCDRNDDVPDHFGLRTRQACPPGHNPIIQWCPQVRADHRHRLPYPQRGAVDRSHGTYCHIDTTLNESELDSTLSLMIHPLCAACKTAASLKFPNGYNSCDCKTHIPYLTSCHLCFAGMHYDEWWKMAKRGNHIRGRFVVRTGISEPGGHGGRIINLRRRGPDLGPLNPHHVYCPCGKDIDDDVEALHPNRNIAPVGSYAPIMIPNAPQLVGHMRLNPASMIHFPWAGTCPVCVGLVVPNPGPANAPPPANLESRPFPQCLRI